jgi:hypothetical protein
MAPSCAYLHRRPARRRGQAVGLRTRTRVEASLRLWGLYIALVHILARLCAGVSVPAT